MSEQLVNTVILQAPNFVGFTMALLILVWVIRWQHQLIILLTEKWERCEDDNAKQSIIRNIPKQSENGL